MSRTKMTAPKNLVALALLFAAGCDAAYARDSVDPSQDPEGEAEPAPLSINSWNRQQHRDRHLSVDVVADCRRFISGGVAHPNANPVFGDYFMQEGLMYRPGTLAKNCPAGTRCGLNADGSPQFPEAVIGKFTCYGSFVGKGAATAAGTWVYTTQVFEFNAQTLEKDVFAPGDSAIVSLGPERNDLGLPWSRAVSGGYGKYRGAQGEVEQTKIGFNQTDCENFTFNFKLDPVRR
jgi:hypothetical protein